MRLIDADAFDKVLEDAQIQCKRNGGNFRFGVLSTVRANLENAPTVSGWISVKDRMPEPNKDVLLAIYCEETDSYYQVIAWQTTSGDWDSNDEVFLQYDDEVTHWMPLPEPPEGSGESGAGNG